MIAPGSRPRLAPKARLRFDHRTGGWLLLYPERGLALTETAAATLRLCTGEHTVETIVARLAAEHPGTPAARVRADVLAFLETLARRALLDAA